MSKQHKFDLKTQVGFQTKIAQREIQPPINYYTGIHFEITFLCF